MKLKVLFLLIVLSSITFTNAQRGVRIGYIDTEYILENVPEYQEAQAQLETKVQKWKTEIETKLANIEQRRKSLSNEKALLTKELYDERIEDLVYEEKEILDYQQKRFGPNGDLMIQKKQLMQPIQDQIFASVQDIAAKKQYDFVFDKSADVVMLYSNNRFDFSDLVIRTLTRTAKRKQAKSKAERRKANEEEAVPVVNEELEARKKALDEKKAERAKLTEQKRQKAIEEREARKLAVQKRRDSILAARKAYRDQKIKERENNTENKTDVKSDENNKNNSTPKTKEQLEAEKEEKKKADRDARAKALEERKQKKLEERAKAKAEREKKNNNSDEDNDDDGDN